MLLDMASTTAATTAVPANWLVVVMGISIVFIGLICIIFIITIMGAIINAATKNQKAPAPAAQAAAPAPVSTEIPNRAEFVAAVSAVIAEELGTDITKIRIESIKKL